MAELLKGGRRRAQVQHLLRCTKTHRYFKDGSWTTEPLAATIFSDELDAIRACVDYDLHDVELVLRAAALNTEVVAARVR